MCETFPRRDTFPDIFEQFLGGLSIDISSTIRLPPAASSIASWKMMEESMILRRHQQTDGGMSTSRPQSWMLDENEELYQVEEYRVLRRSVGVVDNFKRQTKHPLSNGVEQEAWLRPFPVYGQLRAVSDPKETPDVHKSSGCDVLQFFPKSTHLSKRVVSDSWSNSIRGRDVPPSKKRLRYCRHFGRC